MFVIDRFQAGDLVPVMHLASQTLSETYPPEFFMTLAKAQGNLFRVARDAITGEVVGTILAARRPEQRASLLLFAVDPARQGEGIGRTLLTGVRRTLTIENVKELDLEVRLDNERARSFYERHGFEVTGLEEGAYQDGSDALTMARPLY